MLMGQQFNYSAAYNLYRDTQDIILSGLLWLPIPFLLRSSAAPASQPHDLII